MVCPNCGNDEFVANQTVHRYVIVDKSGSFLQTMNETLYDAEAPYGPYSCSACGFLLDRLEEPDP